MFTCLTIFSQGHIQTNTFCSAGTFVIHTEAQLVHHAALQQYRFIALQLHRQCRQTQFMRLTFHIMFIHSNYAVHHFLASTLARLVCVVSIIGVTAVSAAMVDAFRCQQFCIGIAGFTEHAIVLNASSLVLPGQLRITVIIQCDKQLVNRQQSCIEIIRRTRCRFITCCIHRYNKITVLIVGGFSIQCNQGRNACLNRCVNRCIRDFCMLRQRRAIEFVR